MRGVALALLAVAALGCGGPTPKPAAIDLMRAIAARESLRDRKPYLYLATVAAGNLQTLDGFLIGNRSLFPLVTLKPDGLHEGELEPLGVDGQHLLLAGIQGEPRGTIQTLDLDGGRARKAIGPAISEDPWTIRLWGPPHAFLAERKDAAGNVDIALRFGGTDTRAIHFPAAEAPARYFGWAGDEVLYTVGTAETSTLYRLNPAMGGRIAAATFPDALLGVLVVRDPNGQGGVSRGYALTTRQVLPERISLWSWEQ
ncbi:MAG TPA: hypothetical protein VEI97_20620, partial [bacterium]|nr:hypothetical protein [bacterium]